MKNNKEELLNILQNLEHEEFKIFKWFLKQDNILEGFPGIPAAQFKVRGNRQETVDLMAQQYDGPGALEVTLKVLEKINRKDLVQHLQNSSSGGEDLNTHYVGAEAEEFNIQEELVQQFAVDVTSDPDTAYPDLLSADGRQVHPERCRRSVIVLELLVVFVGVCLICRVVYFKTHSVGAHTEEGNLKQANLMVAQQFAECKTQLNQLNETVSILGKQKISKKKSTKCVAHKVEVGNLKQAKLMVAQQFADCKTQLNQLNETVSILGNLKISKENYTKCVAHKVEVGNLKQANLMVAQQFAECKTQLNQLNETVSILGNLKISKENYTKCVAHKVEVGNLKQANLMVAQQFAECKTQLNQLNETVSILGRRVNSITSVIHKAEGGNLTQAKLMVAQQFAVDVTLDPDTAHPDLILSDDGKQVYDSDVKKKLPNNPQRFNQAAIILGKQDFIKVKFYFEVQVKGKTDWDLGVAKKSIKRKGQIFLGPKYGFWTMWLRNGDEYEAKDNPSVRLSLKSPPEKIGVFVDYEEGLVFFYDVDTADLLYSFTGCSFTEKLYPFFSPGLNDKGENSAPLIITPVNLRD